MTTGLRGVWVVLITSSALGTAVGCGDTHDFVDTTAGAGVGVTGGGASAGGGRGGASSMSGAENSGGDDTGPCTPGATKACWERADGSAFDSPPPTTDQTTCRLGERKCGSDGSFGPCSGAVPPEAADTCEPGNDASCNGIPNEGCTCTGGEKRPCGADVGNCKQGEQTCTNATWGDCVGQVSAAPNDGCEPGDDANCNGTPNDDCDCVNGDKMDCGSDVGSCKIGSKICVNGVYPTLCTGEVAPAAHDTCAPGNDANCNGTINENCGCTGTGSTDCGIAVGACKQGKQACIDGKLGMCVGAVAPTTNDTCLAANAANDTNCNGKFRDGCACVGTDAPKSCGDTGCGKQTCDGSNGTWGACKGDGTTARCNPNAPDSKQVCSATGVWLKSDCAAGSVCRDNGASCKLNDGQSCTTAAQCETGACTVFYVDADGDTYPANTTQVKLCGTTAAGYVAMASAKAADCAGGDNNAAVHPGAKEICDGLDNDCNGKTDIADGLPLAGTILQVGDVNHTRRYPAIAWAPEKSLYAIVYRDQDTTPLTQYFVTYDQAGTPQVSPIDVAELNNDNFTIGLTWGGSNFGFTWADNGEVLFRTIASNGSGGLIKSINAGESSNPRVARTATGWGILYLDYGSGSNLVEARTLSDAGDLGAQVDILASSSVVAELASTPTKLVTAISLAANTAKASAWNASFGSPASLTVSGSSPVVASGPDGFAIAVSGAAGAQPSFYSYDANGGGKCGPVKFGDATFTPAHIVGTAAGYVVVTDSTTIRGQQIKSDCTLGPVFTIDATAGYSPRIAGGAAGYGVVWQSGSDLKARFFGPQFCK